jgi:hypothetical protein
MTCFNIAYTLCHILGAFSYISLCWIHIQMPNMSTLAMSYSTSEILGGRWLLLLRRLHTYSTTHERGLRPRYSQSRDHLYSTPCMTAQITCHAFCRTFEHPSKCCLQQRRTTKMKAVILLSVNFRCHIGNSLWLVGCGCQKCWGDQMATSYGISKALHMVPEFSD